MLTPVLLEGQIVTLKPLAKSDVDALTAVGLDPQLWQHQPRRLTNRADMADYVDRALQEQADGKSLPFAILHRATRALIGSTRLFDLALEHQRVEIGATWISPSLQRSGANVEAKLLLMTHAFETMAMQKVVLKTESLNHRSRQAIAALGAVEEGVLRHYLVADDGRRRDMVFYGVLSSEWPAVRRQLQARLDAHRPFSANQL